MRMPKEVPTTEASMTLSDIFVQVLAAILVSLNLPPQFAKPNRLVPEDSDDVQGPLLADEVGDFANHLGLTDVETVRVEGTVLGSEAAIAAAETQVRRLMPRI
ncbi:hypothetical protein ACIQUB_17245 [Rhizobium sp. NPDC090275]|uniref:hypothetical protein n=1 Tax=Rhizobium sp. NPDC090275 TaxID=3364498 RepID=UPI00383A89EA